MERRFITQMWSCRCPSSHWNYFIDELWWWLDRNSSYFTGVPSTFLSLLYSLQCNFQIEELLYKNINLINYNSWTTFCKLRVVQFSQEGSLGYFFRLRRWWSNSKSELIVLCWIILFTQNYKAVSARRYQELQLKFSVKCLSNNHLLNSISFYLRGYLNGNEYSNE